MKHKILLSAMLLAVVVYFSSCFATAPGPGYGSYAYYHSYWHHGLVIRPHDVHGRDWHRDYYYR